MLRFKIENNILTVKDISPIKNARSFADYIRDKSLISTLEEIGEEFKAVNSKAFLIGGAVRDYIYSEENQIQRNPNDFDICFLPGPEGKFIFPKRIFELLKTNEDEVVSYPFFSYRIYEFEINNTVFHFMPNLNFPDRMPSFDPLCIIKFMDFTFNQFTILLSTDSLTNGTQILTPNKYSFEDAINKNIVVNMDSIKFQRASKEEIFAKAVYFLSNGFNLSKNLKIFFEGIVFEMIINSDFKEKVREALVLRSADLQNGELYFEICNLFGFDIHPFEYLEYED